MVERRDGTVLGVTGGRYRVWVEQRELAASLRGRMKQQKDRVLVGDRVSVAFHQDGAVTIEAIGERRSVLKRRNPGRARGPGVREVVANVDHVAVVGAAQQPAWEPHLVDRFVAVAEASGLAVVVIIAGRREPWAQADELLGLVAERIADQPAFERFEGGLGMAAQCVVRADDEAA